MAGAFCKLSRCSFSVELSAKTKALKLDLVVMPPADQRRLDWRQDELGGSRHFASNGPL